jgi:hypothetical protein
MAILSGEAPKPPEEAGPAVMVSPV